MTINEYQKNALRTANKSLTPFQQLQNGIMGLNGEAGECIDILKKHLSSFFNTKVQFTCNDEGKGRISIPFKNEEELERLIAIFDKLK